MPATDLPHHGKHQHPQPGWTIYAISKHRSARLAHAPRRPLGREWAPPRLFPASRRRPLLALRVFSRRSSACTRRRPCFRPARSAGGFARAQPPYRGGRARADALRSARVVGTWGSSSPTAMAFSSRPYGSFRSVRGRRGLFHLPRDVRSARLHLHAHPLARRVAAVVDVAVDRPSGAYHRTRPRAISWSSRARLRVAEAFTESMPALRALKRNIQVIKLRMHSTDRGESWSTTVAGGRSTVLPGHYATVQPNRLHGYAGQRRDLATCAL